MIFARGALALAALIALAVVFELIDAAPALGLGWRLAIRFGVFYAAALLGFAALPYSRRNDLLLVFAGLGVLAEIGRGICARDFSLFEVIADGAGVLAVCAPAHVETLRIMMRDNPASVAFRRRRQGAMAWLSAWILIAGIVFVTLGPQHLRPHFGDPRVERFAAFFLAAGAFVAAYPRRPVTVGLIAVSVAILLELGQLIVPGRDAGVADAIAKALGGVAGAAAAGFGFSLWRSAARSAPIRRPR